MADERVFIRVLFGNEYRLFQLPPHVRMANVIKSLRMPGKLFLGEHQVVDGATPIELGLKTGIHNSTDFRFQPESSENRAASPQNESVDHLLKIIRERKSIEIAEVEEARNLSLSAEPQRQADSAETKCVEQGNNGPPRHESSLQNGAFNPHANLLRRDKILDVSLGIEVPSMNLNKKSQPCVPGRRTLPLERTHGDTVIPHSPWPSDAVFSFRAESESMATSCSSPILQGSRRNNNTSLSEASDACHVVVAIPVNAEPPMMSQDSQPVEHKQNVHTADQMLKLENEVQRLREALSQEQLLRENLERRLEKVLEMLPRETIAWAAEQEHQRLMKELREQRNRNRSQSESSMNRSSSDRN